jgi:haloalkane dehalogenase
VGLPDFPFAPHYTEIANPGGPSVRIHYLDEGPPSSAPVLLLSPVRMQHDDQRQR